MATFRDQAHHSKAHVSTASLGLCPSSVHPERAIPHSRTPTASADAIAFIATPYSPRIRINSLQLLLLQFPRVICHRKFRRGTLHTFDGRSFVGCAHYEIGVIARKLARHFTITGASIFIQGALETCGMEMKASPRKLLALNGNYHTSFYYCAVQWLPAERGKTRT